MTGDNGFSPDRYIVDILKQQINLAAEKKRPWVLLFGPSQAGKTSLLSHAAPPLTPVQGIAHDTHGINWLSNGQVIFIDPAATYLSTYWHLLLRLLKKKKNPLASACFVIDLPSLIYPTEPHFHQILQQFAQQVQGLAQMWQPLHLHIIVTQCDYIFGFPEFFHNLSKEDQDQAFGFSVGQARFKQRFELFIEMMNRCWLTRLHYEPNKNRRIRIYDLPFQLEWLMQPLTTLVDRIPQTPAIILDNVFFCSSKQTTETVNLLSGHFSQAFKFKPTANAPLIKNQRALFIPHMLDHIAQSVSTSPLLPRRKQKKWIMLVYPTALIMVCLATFFIHQYYQKKTMPVHKKLAPATQPVQHQLMEKPIDKPVESPAPKNIEEQIAQIQMIITAHAPTPTDLTPFINLKNALENIQRAPVPLKACYDMAVASLATSATSPSTDPIHNLLTSAATFPEPLASSAKIIAQQTQALIGAQTKMYLDILWQSSVIPVYNQTIKGHYPIDPNSNIDIRTEDFNQFFGPGGIIQVYFNQISPFLDTSGATWVVRHTDNPLLAISQEHLETLTHASLIQKMFYSKQPRIPFITFTLTPLLLSPDNSDFTMNIGGQMLHYTDNPIPTTVNWPGNDGDFVTIQFSQGTQDNPSLTLTGPWAWLRLLDQATIEPGEDTQHFRVTLRVNQNAILNQVTYQLSTDNPVHPYSTSVSSSILHTFHCEPHL